MKGIRKQVFSWLIVFSMCMIPISVMAQDPNEDTDLSNNQMIGINDESPMLDEVGRNPDHGSAERFGSAGVDRLSVYKMKKFSIDLSHMIKNRIN